MAGNSSFTLSFWRNEMATPAYKSDIQKVYGSDFKVVKYYVDEINEHHSLPSAVGTGSRKVYVSPTIDVSAEKEDTIAKSSITAEDVGKMTAEQVRELVNTESGREALTRAAIVRANAKLAYDRVATGVVGTVNSVIDWFTDNLLWVVGGAALAIYTAARYDDLWYALSALEEQENLWGVSLVAGVLREVVEWIGRLFGWKPPRGGNMADGHGEVSQTQQMRADSDAKTQNGSLPIDQQEALTGMANSNSRIGPYGGRWRRVRDDS